MNWGSSKPPQAGQMASKEEGPSPKSRTGTAMPPQCPRCDLTKSQFSRTLVNYQRAYRKKVEGLKAELKTVRTSNAALQQQVKSLKSFTNVHVPSVAAGVVLGFIAKQLLPRLFSKLRRKQHADDACVNEAAQPAEAAEPSPA